MSNCISLNQIHKNILKCGLLLLYNHLICSNHSNHFINDKISISAFIAMIQLLLLILIFQLLGMSFMLAIVK